MFPMVVGKSIQYDENFHMEEKMRRYRRPKSIIPEIRLEPSTLEADREISSDLKINEEKLRKVFQDCSDVVFRKLTCRDEAGREIRMLAIGIDGLVDTKHTDEVILKQLMRKTLPTTTKITAAWVRDLLLEEAVPVAQVDVVSDMQMVIDDVLKGNIVTLVDGDEAALSASLPGWERRGIEEPPSEPVIRGPREGFIETLRTNTALVRRRIRSPKLKIVHRKIGELTQTDVGIAYIDGIAKQEIVDEAKKRLDRIELDAVLESAFIEEFIEDQPMSPFPQVQNTERPDVVCANLLEGKVAIFTDGTPFVLLVPSVFWGALNANEDYYQRTFMATFLRALRISFMMISLLFPSLYVAMTTFQQEMIPTTLLLSIAAARESTPFPAVIEALVMELIFEALREAGVRMPKQIGQAMSIVGALVIGQAAVQAGIISAPMVIVVSATGIASFTFPRYNVGVAIRLLRFPMLILAGCFGIYGMAIGMFIIVTHLVSLRSFGVPYFTPVGPLSFSDLKDVFVRVPRWAMYRRQLETSGDNTMRIPSGQVPSPSRGKSPKRRGRQ